MNVARFAPTPQAIVSNKCLIINGLRIFGWGLSVRCARNCKCSANKGKVCRGMIRRRQLVPFRLHIGVGTDKGSKDHIGASKAANGAVAN